MFPQEKVFVDNRPEAYSVEFFEKYRQAQTDDIVWQKLEKECHFQTIFFYRHDLTPWAQAFLITRVKDPSWVPVYVDGWNIIFVKNNPKNKAIIRQFALPKEMFRIL